MTRIAFTVEGQPLPKQRARVPKSGRSYTPARTQEAENKIKLLARQAGARTPMAGPVSLVARFFREDATAVDLDNMVKLLADGCNGIVWNDDAQVVELCATKLVDREHPRTEVEIREVPVQVERVRVPLLEAAEVEP
jgi:Holliday junction resolvase RusA-like endonuclease